MVSCPPALINVKSKIQVKNKINVKGRGQECPRYTGAAYEQPLVLPQLMHL
jgi:hypothetical protein